MKTYCYSFRPQWHQCTCLCDGKTNQPRWYPRSHVCHWPRCLPRHWELYQWGILHGNDWNYSRLGWQNLHSPGTLKYSQRWTEKTDCLSFQNRPNNVHHLTIAFFYIQSGLEVWYMLDQQCNISWKDISCDVRDLLSSSSSAFLLNISPS